MLTCELIGKYLDSKRFEHAAPSGGKPGSGKAGSLIVAHQPNSSKVRHES